MTDRLSPERQAELLKQLGAAHLDLAAARTRCEQLEDALKNTHRRLQEMAVARDEARVAAFVEAEAAISAAIDRERRAHADRPAEEAVIARHMGMRSAEQIVWRLRDGAAGASGGECVGDFLCCTMPAGEAVS